VKIINNNGYVIHLLEDMGISKMFNSVDIHEYHDAKEKLYLSINLIVSCVYAEGIDARMACPMSRQIILINRYG